MLELTLFIFPYKPIIDPNCSEICLSFFHPDPECDKIYDQIRDIPEYKMHEISGVSFLHRPSINKIEEDEGREALKCINVDLLRKLAVPRTLNPENKALMRFIKALPKGSYAALYWHHHPHPW
jgi:hypothetical protein